MARLISRPPELEPHHRMGNLISGEKEGLQHERANPRAVRTVVNVGLLVYRESSFTQLDVANALAKVGRGKPITVCINSGGGIATERLAIYNSLAAWSGKVPWSCNLLRREPPRSIAETRL